MFGTLEYPNNGCNRRQGGLNPGVRRQSRPDSTRHSVEAGRNSRLKAIAGLRFQVLAIQTEQAKKTRSFGQSRREHCRHSYQATNKEAYFKLVPYCHLPPQFQFYHINKCASGLSLMKTAQTIIADCLPIKCLEAVVCAIHLTNPLMGLDRLAISFKSIHNGVSYNHIILAIRSRHPGTNKHVFGALGVSRKDTLASKPMIYAVNNDLS